MRRIVSSLVKYSYVSTPGVALIFASRAITCAAVAESRMKTVTEAEDLARPLSPSRIASSVPPMMPAVAAISRAAPIAPAGMAHRLRPISPVSHDCPIIAGGPAQRRAV